MSKLTNINTTISYLQEVREKLMRRRDEEYSAMVQASAQYDKYATSYKDYDDKINAIELIINSAELTE